jgi:hypothetical protein
MTRAVTAGAMFLAITFSVASNAAAPKSIEGAWTLSIETMSLRMVLALSGRNLSGTLDYPHGAPFQLKGRFDDGALAFSSDSAGENFTIHIEATGSLKSDDTLEGTIVAHIVDLDQARQPVRTHDDEWKWRAVRSE